MEKPVQFETGENVGQIAAYVPTKIRHTRWHQITCLRGWKEKSYRLGSKRGSVDVASVLSVV